MTSSSRYQQVFLLVTAAVLAAYLISHDLDPQTLSCLLISIGNGSSGTIPSVKRIGDSGGGTTNPAGNPPPPPPPNQGGGN